MRKDNGSHLLLPINVDPFKDEVRVVVCLLSTPKRFSILEMLQALVR